MSTTQKKTVGGVVKHYAKRYFITAMGAMAQGLFASLLIGTILNTLGTQLHIDWLVSVGKYASAMSGPAMAIAIGYALQAPPLVLFSLAAVGQAANELGGAGGPLAVYFVAIFAAEWGKAVSRVGVIHPVESYWLHFGPNAQTSGVRNQMEDNFRNLTEWLLNGSIDFDFISESLLPI